MSIGRNSLLLVFTCTALACLTPACGGDDDNGDNGGGNIDFSAPVAGSSVVGSLSQDDWNALCAEVEGHFATLADDPSVNELTCRSAGFTFALFAASTGDIEQARSACSQVYDACKDSETEQEPTSGTCQEKPSSSCMATVAELEACMDSIGEALGNLADAIPSCSELTADDLEALPGGMMDSPECRTFGQKCPEFNTSPLDMASGF